jgi:isovaleryl-CoA dehydrogenase
MDFELTEEQRIVQRNVHQFMVKEIEPITEQIDREDEFPPGIWKKLGDLGFLGVTVGRDLIY